MLYGSIEVLTFGLDADVLQILWLASSVCVVASIWLGGAPNGEADEQKKTKEQLETAFHAFSNLISLYVSRRDGAENEVEPTRAGDKSLDGADKSRESSENRDGRAPQARAGEPQDMQVNSIDFWREDYWNFDFNLEGDLFAADEEKKEKEDAWKESLKEEENDKEEKEDSKEDDDKEQDRGRANYFGAFFRNRDYPPDVTDPDVQERKKERDRNETPRWRRRDDALDDSNLDVDDSETDRFDNMSSAFEDEASEQENADWEEPVPWNEGPDFEYLENENVSLDDKIAYLRKRVKEGDEESRVELARMLIQKTAISNAKDAKNVLKLLDEAERILREVGASRESDVYDDGEYSELLGQVLLQRPVFYLRNGLKPPMKTANKALNQIRSWAENSFSFESRRLLATAWQTHGNCLLASGGDASALSSFRESREAFEALLDEGCEEVEPSLAFVAVSTAETYASIGDFPKALDSYREALSVFDKYSDQEAFLAEKVNVCFKMSSAFRRVGNEDDALCALQNALESEERLVSFNEGVYFAPLAQLLTSYAELLASKGNYEDAIASLDRAVSTLKRVLAYDSALSRRILAYAHIENILRRRASLNMWKERYARAAEDVEESLEYLTLAVKKEDAFNPSLQIVCSSCLLYDLYATQGLWDYAAKTQESLEQILKRLTREERRNVATLYAQLLLQRHVLLARAERNDEALKATNAAIETLETLPEEDLEDGGVFRDSLLSKAYCQRASFGSRSNENKQKRKDVLNDYRRARELSEYELARGSVDSNFYSFHLELLGQKAAAELRDGLFDEMQDDLKEGVSIVAGLLRARRWSFLEELVKLSRLIVIWARSSKPEFFTLRVVYLLVAYARKLRRRYVENDWSADEQESDSPQSRTILQNLEAFAADMRRARADLLDSCEWEDKFKPYCGLDGSVFHRVTSRGGESENRENGDNSTFDFEKARARFVCEKLANDPKTQTIFLDYEFGLRAIMRRVASGEIELSNVLYVFLDKTTDVYIAQDESFLAAEETCSVVKIFEAILEERGYDSDKIDEASYSDEEESRFLTLAFPFWELQATLLARTSYEALEAQKDDDDPKRAEFVRLLINVANIRTENAYMKAIRYIKKIPIANPVALTRFGVVVGAYFAWLVRVGRVDQGVAFARAEGVALESRVGDSPIGFLAIGTYYDHISQVALDVAEERVFAKECLLKVRDSLSGSSLFFGGKTPVQALERLGYVERRLATIESKDGNGTEANERLRASAKYYAQCVLKGRFQKQAVDGFAETLGSLFDSNAPESGKLASVLFHKLEKRAQSWNKKARRESLDAIWALTSRAAYYYARKRGCFYEANRIYQTRDAFCKGFMKEASEFGFHLVEEKFAEANFYIENGVGGRAIEALATAINVRRIHLVTLWSLKLLSKSEGEFPFQYVFDGFERQIDYANVSLVNLEIWRVGDREKGRKIAKETLAAMEKTPEVAARMIPQEQKTKSAARICAEWGARFVKFFQKQKEGEGTASTSGVLDEGDEANSCLRAYFTLRGYAAILAIDEFGYDRARESLLRLAQEIRLNFGANSFTETICLYYWADAAIDAKRWDDAIRFASRTIRRIRLSKNNAGICLPYYVDALKIGAFARLQRRRPGDLFCAERKVKRALKLIYDEFHARRFTLRSSFYETLFLRAVVERAKGRREEASRDADRAARFMERARKRDVGRATRYIEAQTEPFLALLRAESNEDAGEPGERDDVAE